MFSPLYCSCDSTGAIVVINFDLVLFKCKLHFCFFFNPERATSEELKGRMRFRRRRFADP